MNFTKPMRIPQKLNTSLYFYIFVILFIIVTSHEHSTAATHGSVTFTWQANPTEENVVGYRLYYGPISRLDSSGRNKLQFSYEYCIDFTEYQRCRGKNYANCEDLGTDVLECTGLYHTTPECTLSQLTGRNYFALTAYNNLGESAYTQELQYNGPIQKPDIPLAIISLLLN